MTTLVPGIRTTDNWRVGRVFRVRGENTVGVCVSVTPWGSNQIRWVRLRHEGGKERSYAPSHLIYLKGERP